MVVKKKFISDKKSDNLFSNKNLKKISASQIDEAKILEIFKDQIRRMSYKYKSMSAHSVGGSAEDLVSALNLRTLYALEDWKKRVVEDGSFENRNALDAVKFISCRLRTFCLDLARDQRDHIEPAFQMFDNFHENEKNFDCLVYKEAEVDLWRASLNNLQQKIVEIWKEGSFYNRKDPVKSLIKEAARRLQISEKILLEHVKNLPAL